ncbi:mevalonate kinase family protein [Legionella jordanis]|uniref:Mevalonate kinase n=1 Tax=Legionella jordanis TaxID=456 RepID=A0A0W0VBJ7_9GAMM|nr:hypothetical protein [Legionella jordanis]KTD17471.1 hypothetical protein Ljor_1777 [Legionella jordanis]RMX05189.1 hypothetical protein EAW55_00540 [Legionella jordanis]RMX17445.1 hypothetical protein EAS68_11170 [Legionella jordanis]VEH13440.1 mevalonate kinase [Legionella jordanis]HAT8714359.1 hypothetical protein [Legionella jordanis]
MKWRIPAKTFLLGEYAAIAGGSAIVLTTTPYFELSVSDDNVLHGIHPNSPAGQWWLHHRLSGQGLLWQDPYHGKGGLGASSAQFIGTYLAICHRLKMTADPQSLLAAYYETSWSGEGLKPSGYDVLAQTQNRCVYINRQKDIMHSYDWLFSDIKFLLLHSGQKLETHYHLQRLSLTTPMNSLSDISEQGREAFEKGDSKALVEAVNYYQQELIALNLVAPHSLKYIRAFREQSDVLAAKGCGALGADVILLIVSNDAFATKVQDLTHEGWDILATSDSLYKGRALLKNKTHKTLEILP